MRFYLCAGLLLACFGFLSAQGVTDYAPRLLMPFNDQGKWGYPDTLANLIIAPAYDSVGFFPYGRSSDVWPAQAVVLKGKKSGSITATGEGGIPLTKGDLSFFSRTVRDGKKLSVYT